MSSRGFGILEVIIATFVIGVVAIGVFSLITLTLKSSHDGERRIVATALGNEKMEMIRNLPFASVGTVGGIPAGPVLQTEQVVRNGSAYTVSTDIRNVDDPFDGLVTSNPPDLVNTDYKQVRVQVSWESSMSQRPVLLITQVVPKGLEGGEPLGTLSFQALNAAGTGVPSASVRLVNSQVNPSVDLTTTTNNEGKALIPGLTPSSGTYQLTLTKPGYTSEQTYSTTASFTPDTDHSHVTSIAAQITNKTFFIDTVASLLLQTVDAVTNTPIGNVAYRITGTKTIGTDASAQPVYVLNAQDATDAGGLDTHSNLVWDSYTFAIDGVATGYDIQETSKAIPLVVNPGASETLTIKLTPHTPLSLHVTVISSSGTLIEGASVQVTKTGYDQMKQTAVAGQVFFPDMPENALYTVTVTAAGYSQSVQQVTVDGTVRITTTLAPV